MEQEETATSWLCLFGDRTVLINKKYGISLARSAFHHISTYPSNSSTIRNKQQRNNYSSKSAQVYYNFRRLQKMIQKMVILSLSCIAILTKVVDAGVSSFHDLQTIISPSSLDVLDNLDDYDKFWVDVHQKSCGTSVLFYFCIAIRQS